MKYACPTELIAFAKASAYYVSGGGRFEMGRGSYMFVSPWKGGRGEDIYNYEV
jgi:hypothetical protein